MERVAGKVALVTGAARGQGRSHALRLAEEGADIVAVDLMEDFDIVEYPMATEADLDDTVRAIADLDRRCLSFKADVRDREQMQSAVDAALAEFGQIDIVCANAGVGPVGYRFWEISERQWEETVDVDLK